MTAGASRPLAQLDERARELAWSRWRVIAPCVDDGVPLTRAATHADVPISTARRWLAAYRADGLAGLVRAPRSDRGTRRTRPELVALIEGLALRRPRPSAATIVRRVAHVGCRRGDTGECRAASVIIPPRPGLGISAAAAPPPQRRRSAAPTMAG